MVSAFWTCTLEIAGQETVPRVFAFFGSAVYVSGTVRGSTLVTAQAPIPNKTKAASVVFFM